MTKGDEYREKAAANFRLRDACQAAEARQVLQRVGDSYLALAEQEAWLAGEIRPTDVPTRS
jgi:hypothetical protein